ncbi:MAG: UvrD-helicase domain-containing protein, partial [Candidatus Acidiferrales bacterium]
VTFTRNAAANLLADLRALGVPGCERIRAGTLHAFCFWLLRQQHVFEYLGRIARPLITFTTYGVLQYEGDSLLSDLLIASEFGHRRDCTKRIRAFEAAWARLQFETPGWPPNAVDNAFNTELLRWLRFHHGMLIGEVVPEALRYLRNNPTSPILQAYDHVIVDEYQDLNRAEQELIGLLSGNGATAIVGDVDQSIYRFRHANPEGIADFQVGHPMTHDENLTECRRCPRRVVAIADHLIRHNYPAGAPARLNPMAGNREGNINIVQWDTVEAEAQGIADHIAWLIEHQGYGPGEILVLTPRRLLGYEIRDRLEERIIEVHSFYHEEALERDAAQQALTALILLANNEDRVALRRWLADGSPTGRSAAYQRLRAACEARNLSPWTALIQLSDGTLVMPRIAPLLERFQELRARLAELAGQDLRSVIETLVPAAAAGCEVLRDAALLALDDDADTIERLVETVQSAVTQPEIPSGGDYVRVMSLHKSKGLTSKAVIVAGCVQGLVPFHGNAGSTAERDAILREQRRLFYVATTRCTERLVLSSFAQIPRDLAQKLRATVTPGRSHVVRTIASEFLAELGPRAPAAQAGTAWQAGGFA